MSAEGLAVPALKSCAFRSAALHRSKLYCFVVTCEHGGNTVPQPYAHLFRGKARSLLKTHRGYDAGAIDLAHDLASALRAPLFVSTTTRLLVDLNRSIGHRALFSEITGAAAASVKADILKRHYLPFRTQVQKCIEHAIARGLHVIHISSHSFTPVWNGEPRNADVALLYDPRRREERLLCHCWQSAIRAKAAQQLRVRLNYPYRGIADGFTVHLRRRFEETSYLGIELEVNQRHTRGGKHWTAVRKQIVTALLASLQPGTMSAVTRLKADSQRDQHSFR